MDSLSYLTNGGIDYVDALYKDYQHAPESVAPEWRRFFEGFELGQQHYGQAPTNGQAAPSSDQVSKELSVMNLILAYRSRGHQFAKLNPILDDPTPQPTLALENFGLSEADLDTVFGAGHEVGLGPVKLRDLVQHLEATYCRTIGAEYLFVRQPERINWLKARMEREQNRPRFTAEQKKTILRRIGQANTFETFLHRKFVGQKRFSLEGAEAIIPALNTTIEHGAELGIREFVLGMAHRGRLNVLTNVLRKEYDNVFSEFAGRFLSDNVFDGDVKYHLGFSSDIETATGKSVHLSLVPNPSHLEAVNPVVEGVVRAKIDRIYGGDNRVACPILIHGDASLAGQGVVYEVIQMQDLEGYRTGGTVHLVINNQVGFTTDPKDSRSSTYCTDVAKVTLSPVFHVNGDDIEAVVYVTRLALEYRQTFGSDVFVDIVCYRKYGHNEGDEPRYSQPVMYEAIARHPSPFDIYAKQLLDEGIIDTAYLEKLKKELSDHLDKELEESKVNTYELGAKPRRSWDGIDFYNDHELEPNPNTRVAGHVLQHIAERVTAIPQHLNLHRNISRLLEERRKMVLETDKIDWGMGETLAYGSLLLEGYGVRLSGQDAIRGTFSHRHAAVRDMTTGEAYYPLHNLADNQGRFEVYNSHLSEFAVMGFEFGYASAAPNTLTIWEAQYGDFVNGAQIIIDQFLTATKTKWQRMNGLVLLLPHGYEGGGPEHSSARMERFLTLCAENNMFVCNLTTPAQLFHAFRRQLLATSRRPLVIFSPKSLLRHPHCFSSLSDFTEGSFREIIDDPNANPKKVKRLIFCQGKIYYELLEQQQKHSLDEVAIVRIEQLYPLVEDQFVEILKKYNKAKEYIWAQEEPINMGAFVHIYYHYNETLRRTVKGAEFQGVGRKASASPATASTSLHNQQQEEIIRKALDLAVPEKVTA